MSLICAWGNDNDEDEDGEQDKHTYKHKNIYETTTSKRTASFHHNS